MLDTMGYKRREQGLLRKRLKECALANAERDRGLAAEWFPLEEEAAELCECGQSVAIDVAPNVAKKAGGVGKNSRWCS